MTNVNMEPTMVAVAGTAPARPLAAPLTGEQPESDKLRRPLFAAWRPSHGRTAT